MKQITQFFLEGESPTLKFSEYQCSIRSDLNKKLELFLQVIAQNE